jgi:hypothetical protein
MAAQFGGNLADVETFTDYLGDLIEGKTLWNSGYDYPIGYQIWDDFGIHYSDTEAAWNVLDTYWEFHSHLGELPTIGTVDWTAPWVVGPRIGEVLMVDHGYGAAPELEALHVANP